MINKLTQMIGAVTESISSLFQDHDDRIRTLEQRIAELENKNVELLKLTEDSLEILKNRVISQDRVEELISEYFNDHESRMHDNHDCDQNLVTKDVAKQMIEDALDEHKENEDHLGNWEIEDLIEDYDYVSESDVDDKVVEAIEAYDFTDVVNESMENILENKDFTEIVRTALNNIINK